MVEEVKKENEKFKDLITKIESLTVLELDELIKALEARFGVSAQTLIPPTPLSGAEEKEEKDSFIVHLQSAGDQKIQVIKALKGALNIGLKEAKDLVDGAPTILKEGAKKEEAENLKRIVEEAGGKVELK